MKTLQAQMSASSHQSLLLGKWYSPIPGKLASGCEIKSGRAANNGIMFSMEQNSIVIKENEQTFIDRLAAQRHLYSKAKRLSNLLFVVCVLLPVLLAIAKVIYPNCVSLPKIIVVYSVAATLLRIWLKDLTTKRKVDAARIQQLFDCELFGLEWNKALCGQMPKPEDVLKAARGASYKNLNNWYEPIVSQLPLSVGALVCMRTNVVYDQSLRKAYSTVCYVFTFIAIIAVAALGMWNNTGMWDAFLYGIVPLMPLVTWVIDLHKQHSANYKALCNIEPLIEAGLAQARDQKCVSQSALQEIQNFIYLHRKSSYLVPDCFYKISRKKNEAAAYYGANKVCEAYNLL